MGSFNHVIKAHKARAKKMHGAKKQSSLVKLIKNVALNATGRKAETKYVASVLVDNQPISSTMVSGGTGSELYAVIPKVGAGIESHERVGTRIQPTRLLVNAQIDFDPGFLENFDGWVRYYFVTNKSFKNQDDKAKIPNATFLDLGNGTADDWSSTTPSVSAMYPVKNESWTVLKTRTFRVSKNVEKTTGSATNPYATNQGHSSHLAKFKLKVPKKLIFDDGATASWPNNHGIFVGVVWWASDSTQIGSDTPVLRHTMHSHLYFKDT